jgi:hypothetical protein
MSKRVFVASASGLEPGTFVEMKTAAFKERQDLQEWLLQKPEIIEAEFSLLSGLKSLQINGFRLPFKFPTFQFGCSARQI